MLCMARPLGEPAQYNRSDAGLSVAGRVHSCYALGRILGHDSSSHHSIERLESPTDPGRMTQG